MSTSSKPFTLSILKLVEVKQYVGSIWIWQINILCNDYWFLQISANDKRLDKELMPKLY